MIRTNQSLKIALSPLNLSPNNYESPKNDFQGSARQINFTKQLNQVIQSIDKSEVSEIAAAIEEELVDLPKSPKVRDTVTTPPKEEGPILIDMPGKQITSRA